MRNVLLNFKPLCEINRVKFSLEKNSNPPPPFVPQRKPTRGCALKGATTAVSLSMLALGSEQGRHFFPPVATQPEKGRTTSSSARTKPG